MAHTTDITSGVRGSHELPIDLESHINEQLELSHLLVAALRDRQPSSDVADLLADVLLTRNQLSTLKSYMATTCSKVVVDPTNEDYLILKTISSQLNSADLKTRVSRTSTKDLCLLVSTVKRAVQIAGTLTSL